MGVDGIPLSPGFSADSVDSIAPADWSASDPVCNGEHPATGCPTPAAYSGKFRAAIPLGDPIRLAFGPRFAECFLVPTVTWLRSCHDRLWVALRRPRESRAHELRRLPRPDRLRHRVSRHDIAGIWVAFFAERQQFVADTAQNTLKRAPNMAKHAQNILKICPKYAQNMPKFPQVSLNFRRVVRTRRLLSPCLDDGSVPADASTQYRDTSLVTGGTYPDTAEGMSDYSISAR